MTIAARAALFREVSPESVRGNRGMPARMLRAIGHTGGHADPARQGRRTTVSDHTKNLPHIRHRG
jgi:hypothetical protein